MAELNALSNCNSEADRVMSLQTLFGKWRQELEESFHDEQRKKMKQSCQESMRPEVELQSRRKLESKLNTQASTVSESSLR